MVQSIEQILSDYKANSKISDHDATVVAQYLESRFDEEARRIKKSRKYIGPNHTLFLLELKSEMRQSGYKEHYFNQILGENGLDYLRIGKLRRRMQIASCNQDIETIAGLYDPSGNSWREIAPFHELKERMERLKISPAEVNWQQIPEYLRN